MTSSGDLDQLSLKSLPVEHTTPSVNGGGDGNSIRSGRRLVHFCDGVIEESDTDEETCRKQDVRVLEASPVVNPKTLKWGPYMLYCMWMAGSKTVSACDYVGESLADFFGITSPKYYYEIEEYHRMKEEEKEEDLESAGWRSASQSLSTEQLGIESMRQPQSLGQPEQVTRY